MRTFEYRLYPTKKQSHLLMQCLIESRHMYNKMLETVKIQYEQTGTFPTKYDLTALFKGHGAEHVPATTMQMLADRLSKALKRFLACKRLDMKCGFPRFKQPNRWHSIQMRQYACWRDVWLDEDNKHLHVPAKLGKSIKIKMHRPLEGTPKTAHLVLRADRHWYALIVCETTPQTEHSPSSCEHPDIGIDVGLKSFLTDSEGNTVNNPRYYRKSQARLRRKQRMICRRKKGSRRRCERC
jgi:putative transposase